MRILQAFVGTHELGALEHAMSDRSEVEESSERTREIGSRIAEVAERVGGKKRLAQLSGVSESQLYRYIAGQSQPTIEPVVAMARSADISLEWLATGRGAATAAGEGVAEAPPPYVADGTFVPVPRLEVRVGDAADADLLQPGEYAFRLDWLSGHALDPAHLALIAAHGDAMAPLIGDGEVVLVDRRVPRVEREGVYVVALDGWLLPKILQHGLDGALYVRSANPDYREFVLSAERAAALRVVGRVVWTGRAL